MTDTVLSLIGGGPVALAPNLAAECLSASLPTCADDDAQIVASDGERFSISRGVAYVPLRGMLTPNMFAFERWMGWTTYFGLAETMAELTGAPEVSAIALMVDSPGGLVVGLQSAQDAIAQAARVKPVHGLVNPVCASAAYWLASQCSDIALTSGSVVGSIGAAVLARSHVGPSDYGDQIFSMVSSHARAKRPDPATVEGKTELQRQLDEIEGYFHQAVAVGRGIELGELPQRLSVTGDVADGGAAFQGKDAVARGLVDTLETVDEFMARMNETYAPSPARRGVGAFAQRASAAQALTKI